MTRMKTFLDLLFELTECGDKFTNEQLRNEVNTFLIAVSEEIFVGFMIIIFFKGADTTASAIGFLFITLGMFPEFQVSSTNHFEQGYAMRV